MRIMSRLNMPPTHHYEKEVDLHRFVKFLANKRVTNARDVDGVLLLALDDVVFKIESDEFSTLLSLDAVRLPFITESAEINMSRGGFDVGSFLQFYAMSANGRSYVRTTWAVYGAFHLTVHEEGRISRPRRRVVRRSPQ